jgi:hypothetical protein
MIMATAAAATSTTTAHKPVTALAARRGPIAALRPGPFWLPAPAIMPPSFVTCGLTSPAGGFTMKPRPAELS